ncbi:unnamed protein product [Amoebophrya sp. A25]|nr:unnamed protein product [Amoebophrya sp. A25]|eukprot:GSA25T00014938001.1
MYYQKLDADADANVQDQPEDPDSSSLKLIDKWGMWFRSVLTFYLEQSHAPVGEFSGTDLPLEDLSDDRDHPQLPPPIYPCRLRSVHFLGPKKWPDSIRVCISSEELPGGADLVLHAGDFLYDSRLYNFYDDAAKEDAGHEDEGAFKKIFDLQERHCHSRLARLHKWWKNLRCTHKFATTGNHDDALESLRSATLLLGRKNLSPSSSLLPGRKNLSPSSSLLPGKRNLSPSTCTSSSSSKPIRAERAFDMFIPLFGSFFDTSSISRAATSSLFPEWLWFRFVRTLTMRCWSKPRIWRRTMLMIKQAGTQHPPRASTLASALTNVLTF